MVWHSEWQAGMPKLMVAASDTAPIRTRQLDGADALDAVQFTVREYRDDRSIVRLTPSSSYRVLARSPSERATYATLQRFPQYMGHERMPITSLYRRGQSEEEILRLPREAVTLPTLRATRSVRKAPFAKALLTFVHSCTYLSDSSLAWRNYFIWGTA